MAQEDITISPGIVLVPQRVTVASKHPPSHLAIVTLLGAAKGTLVMNQLRRTLPTPLSPMNAATMR